MRVEICPANGVICKTTYADLHIPPITYMTTKEILMTKAIETPSNSNFISLEKYLDLVRGEAKVLQGLSTHPTDAVAIGLLVDPAHPVVLAAARTERKQRDLTDNDLVAEDEAETAATPSWDKPIQAMLKTVSVATLNYSHFLPDADEAKLKAALAALKTHCEHGVPNVLTTGDILYGTPDGEQQARDQVFVLLGKLTAYAKET